MDAYLLSQYVLSGLVIGIIYSLMALGITFIYGIMKMINWAMGEFYMIGSYVQYALLATVLGQERWYVALPIAMGSAFVDYYCRIKQAEVERFNLGNKDAADSREVSEWEHREYFDLL